MSELLDQRQLKRLEVLEYPFILLFLSPHMQEYFVDDLAHGPAVGLLLLVEVEGSSFIQHSLRSYVTWSASRCIRAFR